MNVQQPAKHPANRVVCVELAGGLGNQMFQFAAGYALAQRTGAQLQFDLAQYEQPNRQDTQRSVLLSCFGIAVKDCGRSQPSAGPGRNVHLWDKVARKLGLSRTPVRGDRDVYRQPGFHFDKAFRELSPPVRLSGYFQSELYFADVAEELREVFAIRVPTDDRFACQLAEIRAAEYPVSIHIRRGDYISQAVTRDYHGVLDEDYYDRAISLSKRLCDRPPRYFVFSDENNPTVLSGLADATYVRGNLDRPWQDMALMSACRGHILANSSFSWWGAWLDATPDKWVIAPRNWFSPKTQRTLSTSDLPFPGWIVI